MIGVLCKPAQQRIVEEFFELFKTPWEFFRPESQYQAVIVTTNQANGIRAPLVVVSGSDVKDIDDAIGIDIRQHCKATLVTSEQHRFPIYTKLARLDSGEHGRAILKSENEPVGIATTILDAQVVRLGYDLFDEVTFLLTTGQPVEFAETPTLDIQIDLLRQWMVKAGCRFIEIPPEPARFRFIACLTHDIDFIGIRNHKCDHTMFGFLYRATLGSVRNVLRGRLTFQQMLQNWIAALSLPFVYAGWANDFWEPFEWYLKVEQGIPATYFLIPFKSQPGSNVPGKHASRRATAYDVSDLPDVAKTLLQNHCELAVHGIDSWHSVECGKKELQRIAEVSGTDAVGIRMHWLLMQNDTFEVLDKAGYTYDATSGYNETIGFRAGTTQVHRPVGVTRLLSLPLHIQDGALFYHTRLDLTEAEARKHCERLLRHAENAGGVVTLLWHDRSHAPERFWGAFYAALIQELRASNCWFATAGDTVRWFALRRSVRFISNSAVEFPADCDHTLPALIIRRYNGPGNTVIDEYSWGDDHERDDNSCSRIPVVQ